MFASYFQPLGPSRQEDVIWIQPFLVSSIARLTDGAFYLAGGGIISYYCTTRGNRLPSTRLQTHHGPAQGIHFRGKPLPIGMDCSRENAAE
jgi:hypothetical protein